MKDQYIDRMNLESEFIEFLRRLFTAKNYNVLPRLDRGPDLELKRAQAHILVELKIHRSPHIARRAIDNALNQLSGYMRDAGAVEAILIITQPIDLGRINVPAGIVIWDLSELVRQTRGFADLSTELAEILKGLQVGAESLSEPSSPTMLHSATIELEEEADEKPDPTAGATIISRLEATKPGRPDATKFEKACEDALRLIFGTEFTGWRAQNEVDEGFQRMDVVARLVPTENPFWSSLASDFRTRYVVFEFKNYTDPISQDQIYTTEKYLYTAALRSVAIIVAREGVSESARKACRGSLREQGKLILCLSLSQLCEMLRKRDGGGDPTDILYEELDGLLMTIAR